MAKVTDFSYPSELVDPYPDDDTWFYGGIARATTDVAVAAWTTQRYSQDDAPLAPMHLAAIRYTDTGPEIGPTLTITTPSEIMICRVIEGHDSQVWVVGGQINVPGIKLGLVNVDHDLNVTFQWKYTVPSTRGPGYAGGVMAASWTDLDLIILVTNEGWPSQPNLDSPWVHVVNMTTGAVIESVQTPRSDVDSSSTYSKVRPQGIALHKESGRLLICGTWFSRTTYFDQAALWSIEVSMTGFDSDWLKVVDVPKVSPNYSYGIQWVTMAATERGWSILLMSSYSYGTVRWFDLHLDGTITPASVDPITWDANSYSYNNLPRPWDCAYDIAYDRSIACYVDWGHWVGPSGAEEFIRGLMHLEADGPTITDTQVLPRSENVNTAMMLNVAVVGPGRYIYLCATTDILQPRGPGYYDSFGPVTYVGGEAPDIVAAHQGGQSDETKRAFRTMGT